MKNTNFRRGFTLVELIVVVGLMGLFSTISIGGYFAATRGMATRGMTQDVVSIIRQAQQTCLIDQVPVALLFMNSRTGDKSKAGIPYGRVVAIKMVGRISYVSNNGKNSDGGAVPGGSLLIDEFADWNHSYSIMPSDKGQQLSVRMYRMFTADGGTSGLEGGLNRCSSLMCAWAGYHDFGEEMMIDTGKTVEQWCQDNNRKESAFRWGLPFHPNNDGLGASDWKVGDGYGVEIASLDLPHYHTFGSSAPNDTKWESAQSPSQGVIVLLPGQVTSSNDYNFRSGKTIEIYRGSEGDDDSVPVAKIDDSMLEDQK